ncbi:hypothetical protein Glove_17g49 [Diversispora epigaea]|uniref:Uncharacterized protein n=1 Tax=Diversispora epigaea TaxID=1348612 RepID=A0A397JXR1_9GLOM|nr:hypothetical protein Glove_17g49 [Diversispora epigaea]
MSLKLLEKVSQNFFELLNDRDDYDRDDYNAIFEVLNINYQGNPNFSRTRKMIDEKKPRNGRIENNDDNVRKICLCCGRWNCYSLENFKFIDRSTRTMIIPLEMLDFQ